MNEYLKAKLSNLPLEQDCYLMKDRYGTIIYVGKAKKLKNRVNSYFTGAHNYKTTKLVSEIADFDFIVTASEKEALVLEINLIKKHRPKYNIQFIDSSSYPYIKLSKDKAPTLSIARDAKKDRRSTYFGPFPDAFAARQTIKMLQQLYPLRRCKNMPDKVCLYYHMGSCLGPCEYDIPEETYMEMRSQIARFLNGDTSDIIRQLETKMNEQSENLEFERARETYELIQSIRHISDKQQIQHSDKDNMDVFAYAADKGYLAVQGFFIRRGVVLEKEFKLMPLYGEAEEEFISFIMQYYQANPDPKLLVIPQECDDALLAEVISAPVFRPVKGYRKKLIDMAVNNARTQLNLKFEVMDSQSRVTEESWQKLSEKLNKEIHRVELFDNSHISGSFTVAACVVYEDGSPLKNEYRLYKLHTGNNDFESMKEVMYRRYFRLLSEGNRMPDCILVDGGAPQIRAAREIMDSLGLDITLCGLAKDDHHQTSSLVNDQLEELPVERDSSLFFLLTRMQDEVHRVAVSYHQKLRKKAQTRSILDEVEGIGEVRNNKLLKHFRNFRGVKEATLEQLKEVLPAEVAESLYQILHEWNQSDMV